MADTPLILAIDAGSLAVRCTLFGDDGGAVAACARRLEQRAPAPDWHEQDAEQIWRALLDALAELAASHDLGRVAAVGLTSQRGACLLWDRATGEPLGPAILWSDRRMEPFVAALRDAGHALLVQVTTGAPLHSFYSAPKLRWMLDNLTGAGGLLAVGQLAAGTLDSWLLWKLTGGATHATDYSNAQRTLLLNLATLSWEPELARLFSVPLDILPELRGGADEWGVAELPELPELRAPIGAVAGDQAAALLGHGALEPGAARCSYSGSLTPLLFCGQRPVGAKEGLALIAYTAAGTTAYGLGSTIGGGALALEWCCSRLGAFASVDELVTAAASSPGDESVIFVPAFAGLTAPQRDPSARAAILGLHMAADRSTIARAALESIAFQTTDALARMQEVGGVQATRLLADGSLARSDLLLQIQADLLGVAVERTDQGDLAALGIAYLAAQGAGLPIDPGFLQRGRGPAQRFAPRLDEAGRRRRMALWHAGVERAAGWDRI
jgi:glycerol kinase